MQTLEDFDPEPEPEHWCAGLPFVGVRPMSPGERDAVTSIARRLLRRWWSIIGILVALVLLPFALEGYRAPNIGAMAAVIVSAVVVLGFFAAIGALAWRALALWRARARFLADLADGTVLEFAGALSASPHADADEQALVTAGVLRRDRAGDQRIAVLTATHRVLYRDSRRDWQVWTVRVRAAAAAPTYAMRVPVSPEIAVAIDPAKELVKRSLNSAEREEIHQYVRQVWRSVPRLLLIFIPCFAIGAMLLLSWIGSPDHRPLALIGPVVFNFFIVRAAWRAVPAFRGSALLSRDLDAGWVITVQPRSRPELGVGDIASPGAPPREYLAISGMVWTDGGRPASWRDRAN